RLGVLKQIQGTRRAEAPCGKSLGRVLLIADAAFLIGMARAVSAVEIFSPQVAVFDDAAQVVPSDGGFRGVPQTGTSFAHDLQPEQQAAEIGGRPPQSAAGLASRIE